MPVYDMPTDLRKILHIRETLNLVDRSTHTKLYMYFLGGGRGGKVWTEPGRHLNTFEQVCKGRGYYFFLQK